MDSSTNRLGGLPGLSAVALTIGGVFALISGLVAVYRPEVLAADAAFAFWTLNTWGWVVFGLGVAGIVGGLAAFTGRESARWFGLTVAGLLAIGQFLFAPAYPIWALMTLGVSFVAIYGFLAEGSRRSDAASRSVSGETRDAGERPGLTDVSERGRRAA
jgi:hypothetical protein